MSENKSFNSSKELIKQLKLLRAQRAKNKAKNRNLQTRKPLSSLQRKEIFDRTTGHCHICGDKISGAWDADHVLPHSRGGNHEITNYLPAHKSCNSARKGFEPQEILIIMKLGVWLKTQIEKETKLGLEAAEKFCEHDQKRASRRVKKDCA